MPLLILNGIPSSRSLSLSLSLSPPSLKHIHTRETWWLDYFLKIFSCFRQWAFAQLHKKLANVSSKFWQSRNEPFWNCQRLQLFAKWQNFDKSGHTDSHPHNRRSRNSCTEHFSAYLRISVTDAASLITQTSWRFMASLWRVKNVIEMSCYNLWPILQIIVLRL